MASYMINFPVKQAYEERIIKVLETNLNVWIPKDGSENHVRREREGYELHVSYFPKGFDRENDTEISVKVFSNDCIDGIVSNIQACLPLIVEGSASKPFIFHSDNLKEVPEVEMDLKAQLKLCVGTITPSLAKTREIHAVNPDDKE